VALGLDTSAVVRLALGAVTLTFDRRQAALEGTIRLRG
jgi:hypothetical protein